MITDVQEETEDLDWFAVDRTGALAHFASGGRGFLPGTVKRSRSDLAMLARYFRQIATDHTEPMVASSLDGHHTFRTEDERIRYLSDFLFMARKGLYSFDCIVTSKRPSGYFLVAAPRSALQLSDLPPEIRNVVERTTVRIPFPCADLIEEPDVQ